MLCPCICLFSRTAEFLFHIYISYPLVQGEQKGKETLLEYEAYEDLHWIDGEIVSTCYRCAAAAAASSY